MYGVPRHTPQRSCLIYKSIKIGAAVASPPLRESGAPVKYQDRQRIVHSTTWKRQSTVTVLWHLLSVMDSDGIFWRKQQTIADDCQMSLRSAQYALKELTEAGVLEVVEKTRSHTTYRFIAPEVVDEHIDEADAGTRNGLQVRDATGCTSDTQPVAPPYRSTNELPLKTQNPGRAGGATEVMERLEENQMANPGSFPDDPPPEQQSRKKPPPQPGTKGHLVLDVQAVLDRRGVSTGQRGAILRNLYRAQERSGLGWAQMSRVVQRVDQMQGERLGSSTNPVGIFSRAIHEAVEFVREQQRVRPSGGAVDNAVLRIKPDDYVRIMAEHRARLENNEEN